MPMSPRNDYSDLAAVIQAAMNPLMSEMQSLKTKVDNLSVDRVTRTDLEKLRTEIVGTYVPRDSYEARHAALIDRNTQLENTIRELRKDYESSMQRIHDRLESGKQQLEERMKQQKEAVEKQFMEQKEAELSLKDRAWLRINQGLGILSIILVVIDWLLQHAKF